MVQGLVSEWLLKWVDQVEENDRLVLLPDGTEKKELILKELSTTVTFS